MKWGSRETKALLTRRERLDGAVPEAHRLDFSDSGPANKPPYRLSGFPADRNTTINHASLGVISRLLRSPRRSPQSELTLSFRRVWSTDEPLATSEPGAPSEGGEKRVVPGSGRRGWAPVPIPPALSSAERLLPGDHFWDIPLPEPDRSSLLLSFMAHCFI